VVFEGRTIAGHVLMPFLTRDTEGFDVNRPYDWSLAEQMVENKSARLCTLTQPPYRRRQNG